MPRTRQQGSEEDEAEEPSTITMGSEQFAALMHTLQQSQADIVARLIHEVRTSTPAPVFNASAITPAGNFTKCTARFSGKAEDTESFIDAVNVYKDCVNISEENAIKGFSMLLTDSAALWWQGIKSGVTSWQDAIEKLQSAFGERRPPFRIYLDLFALRQNTDPTDLFISKTRALISKLPERDLSEKVQIDMVYGLLDRRIRKRVERSSISSFEQLLQRARAIEDSLENGADQKPRTATPAPVQGASTAASTTQHSVAAPVAATGAAVPANCDSSLTRAKESRKRLSCNYCKKWGHEKANCKKLIGDSEIENSVKPKIECFGCGAPNVIRSKCEKCKVNTKNEFCSIVSSSHVNKMHEHSVRDSRQSAPNSAPVAASAHSSFARARTRKPVAPTAQVAPEPAAPAPPQLSSRARSRRCLATARELASCRPPADTAYTYFGTSGNPANTAGDCLELYCDNRDELFNNCVTDNKLSIDLCTDNVIIGKELSNNFLCKNNIIGKELSNNFLGKNNNVCLDLSSYSTKYVYNAVNCKNDCEKRIARTQGRIQGEFNNSRPLLQINILGKNGTALLDTGAKGCIAGQSLYRVLVEKGHPLIKCTRDIRLADGCTRLMEVLIANVEVGLFHKMVPTEFIIFPDAKNNESLLGIDFIKKAGLTIDFTRGLWHFSENKNQKYKLLLETSSPRRISYSAMNVLRDDEGTCLQEQERDELAQLLSEFHNLFDPIGEPTPYVVHHIDTGNHAPIATPPYRLTPAKKEVMQKELNKMLADGIVEDCESAWGAPALLVPKRDGSFRFCVDYRKLNSITKSDAYPMPRIDEILQSTKRGSCHMSTIDLRSGYWQVSVKEEDRDKTAFVTPFGTFRFKRMPFGLKNGPATFQRLIDRMRSGSALKDITILAYLDDLIIISVGGFTKHLEDLRVVFEQLMKFKLRANREKCVFARQSFRYLGHVISQEGVSADKDKIRAILDMEPPSSLKHLRTFIQTCSWFRKFIPGFSQVAEPLTRLTRKNQSWTWGPQQTEAFSALKKLLTSTPILIQADYSKPFILRTDASNYALGAVLLQGEKNEERPIEFASRLLSSAERNYSTTEREALAVVWAVDRFRGYIDGHPVVIGSDHQPLKWLLSLKSPSGRLVRWALKLQSYDLHFEYTPGKINVVADTLSRPVCTEESRESCGICSVIVDLPTRDLTELRAEQQSDPDINKIIKELEDTEEVATRRWTERGYLLDRGILYRYNPDTDNESPQLVIPACIREEILRECHDAPVAGHPGIEKTYQKVAQNYFFPGMRRIITDYVKSCATCQRYKATNEKPPGLIQTPILNQRNEVLAIDLFGPLPEGENGEKWILLVEDTATRWVELYALREATSSACAKILIEEYFLRYGLCRRIISDNGVQFVSAVMQKCMYILGITQDLIPFYHPEANPAERKNRDMKTRLAQLVGTDHPSWPKQLPIVRFSMNSSVCETTGVTPAFLTFARELKSPLEVYNDPKAILEKENFVPQITPYLRKFLNSLSEVRDRVEKQQDKRKLYADRSRREGEAFNVGDKVLLITRQISDASKSKTAKFFPKRDGPYIVLKKMSPTTYLIASAENSAEVLGKFHVSELTPFQERGDDQVQPLVPKKKRGRPRLQPVQRDLSVGLDHDRGRNRDLEGEYVAQNPAVSDVGCTVRGSQSQISLNDQSGALNVGARNTPPAEPSRVSARQSLPNLCAPRHVSTRARRAPLRLNL